MTESTAVRIELATRDNFAPFGHLISPEDGMPDFAGPNYSTWRYPLHLGGTADLTMLRHQYRPVVCARLERHSEITELRVPLDHRPSIVFLAATPHEPSPAEVHGFLVPGDCSILIARDCWHSSSFATDPRGAQFILISDRETEAELEEAGLDGTPAIRTQVLDWTGKACLVPDFGSLGKAFDRFR
ncbi:ureidoglycolate lyase [Rhodobacter sp. 24-YEA-8]|uniref:ureidoglycolate lyase n=1 Tax=Rhodobacter sp. 24-YEA-8 TaxID=1884310 RepID=UPI0008999693|nr:ureidoglycolate lyase [Rhodobacter sp. 24-YEA-8]SED63449.1 Ureidoglycolate hydrolase (allantoin degradation) [Rhodobacter sp. 24-YEA-8]